VKERVRGKEGGEGGREGKDVPVLHVQGWGGETRFLIIQNIVHQTLGSGGHVSHIVALLLQLGHDGADGVEHVQVGG